MQFDLFSSLEEERKKHFFISRGYPEEMLFFCFEKPFMTEEVSREEAENRFIALKIPKTKRNEIFKRAENEGRAIYKTYSFDEYFF